MTLAVSLSAPAALLCGEEWGAGKEIKLLRRSTVIRSNAMRTMNLPNLKLEVLSLLSTIRNPVTA